MMQLQKQGNNQQVGTVRYAVRAAFSSAIKGVETMEEGHFVPHPIARVGTSQRDVPTIQFRHHHASSALY
jgi:hypothetical protein